MIVCYYCAFCIHFDSAFSECNGIPCDREDDYFDCSTCSYSKSDMFCCDYEPIAPNMDQGEIPL